jgi:hypothetical protein
VYFTASGGRGGRHILQPFLRTPSRKDSIESHLLPSSRARDSAVEGCNDGGSSDFEHVAQMTDMPTAVTGID